MEQAQARVGDTVAGRYHLHRVLGAGGMGAVYVATQEPLGREVALKLIRASIASDPAAVERFTREARTVAGLQHPNIVTLHDFGASDDGALFLAMELLAGEPLSARVHRGALPWAETVRVCRDVTRALVRAHAQGVVHRDLKPDNVMLVPASDGHDAHAKVVDFGVAKLLDHGEGQTLTGTGMSVGTPGYMAPEQINGEPVDGRADLYALGVMWFEMITGRTLFDAPTPMKRAVKHLTEDAPRPSVVAPDIALLPAGEELILRLLSKAPEGRPANAEVLLKELDALDDHAPVTPLAPAMATEPAQPAIATPSAPSSSSNAPLGPPTAATPTAQPALVSPPTDPAAPIHRKTSRLGAAVLLIVFVLFPVSCIACTALLSQVEPPPDADVAAVEDALIEGEAALRAGEAAVRAGEAAARDSVEKSATSRTVRRETRKAAKAGLKGWVPKTVRDRRAKDVLRNALLLADNDVALAGFLEGTSMDPMLSDAAQEQLAKVFDDLMAGELKVPKRHRARYDKLGAALRRLDGM